VEEAGQRAVRVRFVHHQRLTRPGGTIPGAAASRARFRRVRDVTANLNINFLAEPKPRDLLAEVRRISRPAAAGEVVIVSEAVPTPVAHPCAGLPRKVMR